MKIHFKLFTLLALFSVLSISCGEDECLVLSESIIGTWEASILGEGEIEFQSDGTLIDENDILVSFETNGVAYDQKSWELIEADSKLSLRAENSGAGFFEIELDVASFDCETITLQQFGINVSLTKK